MNVFVISEATNGAIIAVARTKKNTIRIIKQLCACRHEAKILAGLAHLPDCRYNYTRMLVRA